MKVCPNCGCILEPLNEELTEEQLTVVTLLEDFAVQPTVAHRLAAAGVHPEIAKRWIAYARGAKLHNPPGLVVAKLKAGEKPVA